MYAPEARTGEVHEREVEEEMVIEVHCPLGVDVIGLVPRVKKETEVTGLKLRPVIVRLVPPV